MKLAIYDFDGTYIDVHSITFLFKLWKEEELGKNHHKKIWRKIIRRHVYSKLGLFGWTKKKFRANAMELTVDLFHTIDREELDRFLDLFYERIKSHVSDEIRTSMLKDKEDGFHTVLLSGNYDIILKRFLNEGFNQVIGTNAEKDGNLLTSSEVSVIINNRKSEIIKETFPDADFEASKAYADSDYDLPIFELVGHPIAVNPDEELLKIAKDRGFDIMYTK